MTSRLYQAKSIAGAPFWPQLRSLIGEFCEVLGRRLLALTGKKAYSC